MLISFTTKRTKDTKGSEIDIFEFLNFVLFVPPLKITAGVKRCDSKDRHPRMF
jgi:hypothetical protein